MSAVLADEGGRLHDLTVTDRHQRAASVAQESLNQKWGRRGSLPFSAAAGSWAGDDFIAWANAALLAAAAVMPAATRDVNVQAYPIRPVHVVAAVPPGNGPDTLARRLGRCLFNRLGQWFIVDDRPDADDTISESNSS
jgi:hypothetical protein